MNFLTLSAARLWRQLSPGREWLLRRQNSILGDPGAVIRVGKKGGESFQERKCRNSYMGKRLV